MHADDELLARHLEAERPPAAAMHADNDELLARQLESELPPPLAMHADECLAHQLEAELLPAAATHADDDERLARQLEAEFPPPLAMHADDDERLARQLEAELPPPPVTHGDDDERLARQLEAELNGGNDDASLALALHLEAELNNPPGRPIPETDLAADAAFAASLANEDRIHQARITPGEANDDNESASLALALSLSEAPPPSRSGQSRRSAIKENNAESERLLHQLFAGSASCSATAAAAAAAPALAAPAVRGGPSYAMVVGEEGCGGPAPWTGGALVSASCPPRACASVAPAPRVAMPRGPQLIIDGANVAFGYGGARGFDAEGIRRCVDYFAARRSPGRQLPGSAIVVTLNESRWDGSDAALCNLEHDNVLAWTPVGKDDDVFLLQCAADHGAWVVTNDRWTDHRASRHATNAVRGRVLRYAWLAGSFAPASDDLARFDANSGSQG